MGLQRPKDVRCDKHLVPTALKQTASAECLDQMGPSWGTANVQPPPVANRASCENTATRRFTPTAFANSSPGRGPRSGSPRGVGALLQPWDSDSHKKLNSERVRELVRAIFDNTTLEGK